MKIYCLFFFYYLLFLFSCKPSSLDQSLDSANENRTELQKVLDFYMMNPEDSLKYKSACYLIENMPYHYSYSGKSIDMCYNAIDSMILKLHKQQRSINPIYAKEAIDSINNKYLITDLKLIQDINCITADFLIQNIDQSFEIWEKSPWAQHLSFEDFCEYLLPYKLFEFQVNEDWRASLKSQYDSVLIPKLEVLKYSSEMSKSAFWACKTINGVLKDRLTSEDSPKVSPNVYRLSTQVKIPYGVCADYVMIATGIMRSYGVPVVMDFTPQWPFRNLGHTWNVLLSNNGKKISFGGCDTDPDILHKADQKMAKVYRRCYSVNHEILRLNQESEAPGFLKNIFIKDVTSEYMQTEDIEIKITKKCGNNHEYAYLAVFDNAKWIPVCYGKKKGDKYLFSDVGKDILYLPIYYSHGVITAFADPFILNQKGKMVYLKTDNSKTQTLNLNRKYYISQQIHKYVNRLVGGKIQASTDPNFLNAEDIHVITKWSIFKDSIMINTNKSYRYWRYLSPPLGLCNIAELAFYENVSLKKLTGRVIGTDGSYYPGDTLINKYAVFDEDPLSYFDAPKDSISPWVGMDFGKPVHLGKIIYIPRNDDNNVTPGDQYELLYWEEKWRSLGKKRCDSETIVFHNAPDHALFWLRNLTKGKEERIFTYERGEQVWW